MPLIYLCCLDTVEDLRILAEDDKQFEKVIPQGQLRTLIVRALSAATPGDQPSSHPGEDKGRESDDQPGQSKEQAQPKQDVSKLPPGVHFHYFASHKKQHSRFGRDSASEPTLFLLEDLRSSSTCPSLVQESLALKFKDVLRFKYDLVGWFDGKCFGISASIALCFMCDLVCHSGQPRSDQHG